MARAARGGGGRAAQSGAPSAAIREGDSRLDDAGGPDTRGGRETGDSRIEATAGRAARPRRWGAAGLIGWRLRALMALALLGLVAMVLLARTLAQAPHLPATWEPVALAVPPHAGQPSSPAATPPPALAPPASAVRLAASSDPALAPHLGQTLRAVQALAGTPTALDPAALLPSPHPRWIVDDAARARHLAAQQALTGAMAADGVRLHFGNGADAVIAARPRGAAGLGWSFWPLAAVALALWLTGAVVALGTPRPVRALYALMCLCQAGQLLLTAAVGSLGGGVPPLDPALTGPLASALDVVTAAAVLHALALHPRRVPGAAAWIAAAWAVPALWFVTSDAGRGPAGWTWTQAAVLGLGLAALAAVHLACRREPHPTARVLRRFAGASVATAALLTAAVAGAGRLPPALPLPPLALAEGAAVLWTLFFAGLLLLVPFLARSRQLLREFALLAGVGSVALSLDLLFAALLAVGPFASLGLAVVVAVALYAGARQWLLQRLQGQRIVSTERTFEQLYRAARELQARPERHDAVLAGMLQQVFQPMAVERVTGGAGPTAERAGTADGGAELLVPLPPPVSSVDTPGRAARWLRLRYAQRGERLFMRDDARLADRLVEQLQRAAAYDHAVERGRSEERLRIAQDLHDDIGARLLTLMYRAPSPEMEDYIRHTLKDLKTLTRGLATAEHRLLDAAAEWKADLTQRCAAAQLQLGWSFSADRDLRLTMVQWSGLTRVLRELSSNVLAHAQASRIDIRLSLRGRRLALRVADDGQGRAPETWAHGLGLGGVRKRVKQLGGTVAWREHEPRGIVCEVLLPEFAAAEEDTGAEDQDATPRL